MADDERAEGSSPGTTDTGTTDAGTTDADGLRPVEGAYFAELPVTSIVPNPRQPRQVFDEDAMAELVHSVREIGLLQPIVVRSAGEGRYELIMGERRWRATQEAGLEVIPAIVRETDDDVLLRDALLENLHRSELNPLEEAAAYQQLLDDFGCTHEELAGPDRPEPPADQQHAAAAQALPGGAAAGGRRRALRRARPRPARAWSTPEVQDRLAARVVAEGISVRGLEEIVAVGDLGSGPVRDGPAHPPDRPGAHRPRRPALRPSGDPRQGRPRQAQGPDHRRVRVAPRPRADHRPDRPGAHHARATGRLIDSSLCRHSDKATNHL